MLKTEPFTEYFELYSSLRQRYDITPQETYNVDENGFAMAAIQRANVFISVSESEALLRQVGNREWVFIIETISASGESLSSFLTFKGVYQQRSWHEKLNTRSSKIATSPKG